MNNGIQQENSFSDLLESLKKELNTILEDSQAREEVTTGDTTARKDIGKDKKVQLEENQRSDIKKPPVVIEDGIKERPLDRSEMPNFASFMESQGAKNLDEDVQKMKVELMKSYELFQKIGEKFETINFGSLKTRIRDLHLNNKSSEPGKATTAELEGLFNSSVNGNNLDKLTSDMAKNFRKHPGEFGDIPELSEFFKACTQLEHGLDQIKRQRIETRDLEKRMLWASENTYKRIDEIRNSIAMDKA